MTKRPKPILAKNTFLLRMHPLQRILLSLLVSIIFFFVIKNKLSNWQLTATALWDGFAIPFIISSWIVIFTRPVSDIKKQANVEDGSRLFVLLSILISAFASMLAVTQLMTSAEQTTVPIIMAITGMLSSWALVHTIFTFHYAHLYYSGDQTANGDTGLDFPGEKYPDYVDFAYFSFVIGMTFQVSDVSINLKEIRRTALAHSLLAFILNTFVVALTINQIANLRH